MALMKLHFPGQKENEDVLFVVRKHWILYVKLGMFLLLMVGIPFLILLALQQGADLSIPTQQGLGIGFLIYLDFMLLFTFIRWMEEEADLLIVTNERILSVNQISFLHRMVSESELTQIQDVKHVAKGLLSNLLGFGSLEVQTAGERILFEMKGVANPYEMSRKIMDLCRECKQKFAGAPWSGDASTPLPPSP